MIKKIVMLSLVAVMCIFPGFMHQSFAAEGIRIEIDGKPLPTLTVNLKPNS